MKKPVIALVPCRAGSERVKHKNTREFVDGKSLTAIKIEQLLAVDSIDQIIVSTNDEAVKDIANTFDSEKIVIHDRDPYYASSSCSNDEFVQYFCRELPDDGTLLWTHVTSPFCTAETYNRAFDKFASLDEAGHDSLLSVDKIQGYVWDEAANPVSYSQEQGKWPRTQTIAPLFHINSAIFVIELAHMSEIGDRVGRNPYMFELSHQEGIDIDWEEDFVFAQKMHVALA